MPIEAIVIPTWQAESDSSILSSCSITASAPALALLGELLDLAAAAADERELGRDEEAVDRHQDEQQDEQQGAHRLFGPVLRGRSSSAIRRTEYSFAPAYRRCCNIGARCASRASFPPRRRCCSRSASASSVVAVTHECDYPPEARSIPHLTSTVLPPDIAPGEIDAAVKAIVGEGRALYELDEERLAELGPDLIVTQAVCDVCAVSYEDVLEVAARLPGEPCVLQQDPSTLGEVLEDVIRLGEATGMQPEARELRGELEGRLATVRAAVAGAPRRG